MVAKEILKGVVNYNSRKKVASEASPMYNPINISDEFTMPDNIDSIDQTFQPLTNDLMEAMGYTPTPPIEISNKSPGAIIVDKGRSNSMIKHSITIELPPGRTKSSSFVRNMVVVKTPHGYIRARCEPNVTALNGDNVIIRDGPILIYGQVVPFLDLSTKSEEEKGSKIFSFTDVPTVQFVDKRLELIPSLQERDCKAMILLKLIMERLKARFDVVYLETVSLSKRAAFHLGYKNGSTQDVQDVCRQLVFLYGCPVFPLPVD